MDEVREVAPGVYALPTDYPQVADAPLWIYLIRGPQNTLSDAACATTYDAVLRDQLRSLGLGAADIDWLLLTHAHPDHTGAAPSLRADGSRFRVAAPLDAVGWAESFDRQWVEFWEAFPGVVDVAPHRAELAEMAGGDLMVDHVLRDGEVFNCGDRRLLTVQTRDHTPGHCAYFDEVNRVLFSGDVGLGGTTPSSSGASNFLPLYIDVNDYVAALRRLRALPFDVLCPAHHEAVDRARGLELIDESLAFVDEVERLVLDAVATSTDGVTLKEIARRVGESAGMEPAVWLHSAYVTQAHLRRAAQQGLVVQAWQTVRVAA